MLPLSHQRAPAHCFSKGGDTYIFLTAPSPDLSYKLSGHIRATFPVVVVWRWSFLPLGLQVSVPDLFVVQNLELSYQQLVCKYPLKDTPGLIL